MRLLFQASVFEILKYWWIDAACFNLFYKVKLISDKMTFSFLNETQTNRNSHAGWHTTYHDGNAHAKRKGDIYLKLLPKKFRLEVIIEKTKPKNHFKNVRRNLKHKRTVKETLTHKKKKRHTSRLLSTKWNEHYMVLGGGGKDIRVRRRNNTTKNSASPWWQ